MNFRSVERQVFPQLIFMASVSSAHFVFAFIDQTFAQFILYVIINYYIHFLLNFMC